MMGVKNCHKCGDGGLREPLRWKMIKHIFFVREKQIFSLACDRWR